MADGLQFLSTIEKRESEGKSTLNHTIALVTLVTESRRQRRPAKCIAESHVSLRFGPLGCEGAKLRSIASLLHQGCEVETLTVV